MRRLQQLLQSRIVYVDDVLYFSFKKHIFSGSVVQGGLIWKCTWQKPGEEPKNVFCNPTQIEQQPYIRTFESLTDWTETCIQECLDEYHTRYSSWKRVRHKRTEQPMEVLFKHLQKRQITRESEQSKQILLYEQLAGQKNYIESLKKTIHEWTTWFENTHKGIPNPVEMPVEQTEEREEQAQPFVLTSDNGQYMVLHRVNEVAPPECISWLKENGQNSFEKILQSVHFEPAKQGQDTWAPIDEQTSKRFVHNFFN
tara:strand:- start:1864 stop:2628 length:765 start_codon:yes stop_codon:yes gene_type:complete